MKKDCRLIMKIYMVLMVLIMVASIWQLWQFGIYGIISIVLMVVLTGFMAYAIYVQWESRAEILERLEYLQSQVGDMERKNEYLQAGSTASGSIVQGAGIWERASGSWQNHARDWKCQVCGRVNAGYTGTCACGCDRSGKRPEDLRTKQGWQSGQDAAVQGRQADSSGYCASCGRQLEPDAKFCTYCGNKIG